MFRLLHIPTLGYLATEYYSVVECSTYEKATRALKLFGKSSVWLLGIEGGWQRPSKCVKDIFEQFCIVEVTRYAIWLLDYKKYLRTNSGGCIARFNSPTEARQFIDERPYRITSMRGIAYPDDVREFVLARPPINTKICEVELLRYSIRRV